MSGTSLKSLFQQLDTIVLYTYTRRLIKPQSSLPMTPVLCLLSINFIVSGIAGLELRSIILVGRGILFLQRSSTPISSLVYVEFLHKM